MNRCGHVCRERPWRRGPNQQALAFSVEKRELQIYGVVGDLLIALGHNFMLRQARSAARAPGHGVPAFVDPTPFVATLQKAPDGVVIFVRHRVIRVVPVHPHRKPFRLLRNDPRIALNTRFTLLNKTPNSVIFDVVLGCKVELFLDLDFDP